MWFFIIIFREYRCTEVNLVRFDYGIRDIIESNIHWLIKQISRAIIGCQESLKKIRPGVAPVDLPQIIWLPMLARPFTSDQYFWNIWSQ